MGDLIAWGEIVLLSGGLLRFVQDNAADEIAYQPHIQYQRCPSTLGGGTVVRLLAKIGLASRALGRRRHWCDVPLQPVVNSRPASTREPVAMGLAECAAGGRTFSLAWADIADPALIGPALSEMQRAVATKLGAKAGNPQPLNIAGMTSMPQAQSQLLLGSKQQARMAVFSRGLRVYQVLMVGAQDDPAAWDIYMAALTLDS